MLDESSAHLEEMRSGVVKLVLSTGSYWQRASVKGYSNVLAQAFIIIIIIIITDRHIIITDRRITCNKPDIIIQEKDSERCLIIGVAIPSDYNIQKKVTEKMSKYVDLQIECQRM